MQSITLENKHDPDLRITISKPSAALFESAYAEWFNGKAKDSGYLADYELLRACSSVKGEAFVELLRQWSGLPLVAWQPIALMADAGGADVKLHDPRALLDSKPGEPGPMADLEAAGVSREQLAEWLRAYPRKGPAGKGQLVVVHFPWGWTVVRAAEPTEWFTADPMRASGKPYEAFRMFVQSCTLFPKVSAVLERNADTPALVPALGSIIRDAAGEDLAKRVGE